MGNRTTRRGRRVRTPDLYSPEESVLDDYDEDEQFSGSDAEGGGESDADTRSSEQDDSLGSLRDFVANDDSEVEQASSSESEPEDSDCSADDSEDSVDDIECTEQEDEDETSIDTDDSAEAGRGRKRRAVKKKKPHNRCCSSKRRCLAA